jgi:hypothetical protein
MVPAAEHAANEPGYLIRQAQGQPETWRFFETLTDSLALADAHQ